MGFGPVTGMTSGAAVEYDVAFRAETGEFRQDISEATRIYESSVKQMSTESIKLSLAQEKLDRALAKGVPTSREVQRAELARRKVLEEVSASTRKVESDTGRLGGALQRLGRSSTAGSGSLIGLSRGGAALSATLAGGAGIAYALRSFVDAARDSEVVLGQTSVAVRDAGLDWERYKQRIDDAASAISRGSAFDDEEVLKSIAVFVRSQKDVEKSIDLAGLAADVARGRYTDLSTATELVNKAAIGQVGALRRVGIQIDKNASSAEALDALQRAYADSAKRYAESSAGAADRLGVSYENLKETFGEKFAEALGLGEEKIADITDKVSDAKVKTDSWTDSILRAKRALHIPWGAQPSSATTPVVAPPPKVGRGQGAVGAGVRTVPPVPPTPPPKFTGLTVDDQIALERAYNTKGTDDEEQLLELYLARVRRAEHDKRLTKKELLELVRLEGQLNSELQTIIDQRNADNQAAADRRAEAERLADERRAETERRRAQAAHDRMLKEQAATRAARKRDELAVRQALTSGPYATTHQGFAGGRPAGAIAFGGASSASDRPATAAEIAAAVRNAIAAEAAIQRRFAPNFQLGTLETQGHNQTHELRRQTDAIERLVARTAFPASTYAHASALVAGA